MNFIDNIEKNEYEEFVKNHKKSHFLQSYAWGQFCKESKGLTPYYVGVKKNKKLIASALLLQKKLPLGYSYFYSPRGYIVDYNNFEIMKFLNDSIKNFTKKKKAIFIKIDPDIIWKQQDSKNNTIDLNFNPNTIFKNITKLGFKHLGFNKGFEHNQPRYTFRIDLEKKWEDIENNFSKTTKQRIKKSEEFIPDIKVGSQKNIKDFYNLMRLTENRKHFVTHDEDYYSSLYKIWHKDNSCNIFLGTINLKKIIDIKKTIKKQLNTELEQFPKENLSKSQNSKKREIEQKINKTEETLSRYMELNSKYKNDIILSAHFIIEYGDKAWVLYAGNHNILTDTYINYKTYNEHIKYYHNKGIKIYDQFGTIGNLNKDNPLLGLHEFKKKFGGDYTEFIGEFDLILNKPIYFAFVKLVPIYRNIIKKISKRKKGQK